MSYILILTLVWGLGLLVYGLLLLRNLAAHSFNRCYLLIVILGGLVLPLVPGWSSGTVGFSPLAAVFNFWLPKIVVDGVVNSSAALPAVGFDWSLLLVALYGFGLLASVSWLFIGIRKLIVCFGESRRIEQFQHPTIEVFTSNQVGSPVSYGNKVWIGNWASVDVAERDVVLALEAAHSRLGHVVDNVASALVTVVCWFHPLAHVLRRELRSVHEFQADAAVLAALDVHHYRHILLRNQLTSSPALAYGFAGSPLQQRFTMMTTAFRQNQRWRLAAATLGPFYLWLPHAPNTKFRKAIWQN